MTTALFVHDHRFFRDIDGRVYSEGKITNEVFQRYFAAVDNVIVFSRMVEVEDADGLREITEDNVSFSPVIGSSIARIFSRSALKNAISFQKLIDRSDMAIIRFPSFLGIWAAYRFWMRGIPYFVEVVGFPREAIAESGSGVVRKILAHFIERLTKRAVARAAGAVYVTREVLQKRFPNPGLTAFASNVELMDDPVFRDEESYALGDGPIIFGLIGSFTNRYKGIDVAIQSIGLLRNKGYDCQLLILGSGDREMVLSDGKRLGVDDCIEFSGSLSSSSEVYAWLDKLDIYLQPSRTEGLPRALVEAMSRGLPALASDAGGITELLPEACIHPSGDYIKLASQMERLIGEQALRASQGQRNATVSQDYTRANLKQRRQAFWATAGDMVFFNESKSERKLLLLGSYAQSLINFRGPLIQEILATGYRVAVGAPNISAELKIELEELGAEVYSTPLRRTGTDIFADVRYGIALYLLIRRFRPNIVLTYTIKPNIWGAIAAKFAGVSSFAMVTGLGYIFTDSAASSLRQRAVRSIARQLYRIATNFNTRVIFQNPDDLNDFHNSGCLANLDKGGIVDGSGVDVKYYSRKPLPHAPVFLMIARLLRNKGVHEYAEASLTIIKRHPQVRCILVGPFDEGPDRVSQDDLDFWVLSGLEYLGPLRDVRPAIAQASVYILPSYREGTPRSVLEAMAMGRAIITTDVPGCRETIRHGEEGFLVPVRDVGALTEAMEKFVTQPNLAKKIGDKAFVRATQKYDVPIVNQQVIKILGL